MNFDTSYKIGSLYDSSNSFMHTGKIIKNEKKKGSSFQVK